MRSQLYRWGLGLIYIFAVATIWIAASFIVQKVEDNGVSPFLVTYICNSLFIVCIPLVEIGRYLEDNGSLFFWRNREIPSSSQESSAFEKVILLDDDGYEANESKPNSVILQENTNLADGVETGLDEKGRWTRLRVAKVSLLICPIWFLAQLTFNLSLKYTTVTSNTILSSASSLFTFLVALVFLGEKFTWMKLISVLLCMVGTIIVSLGDSGSSSKVAPHAVTGDILALLSSAFYAVYITLIRQKLPDEDDEVRGRASMAQFLGFVGLFNLLIFLPVALLLHFSRLEPFNSLTGEQFRLIIGKGLLDNVLSDYLWAKAVLLTTTTVATAGLSIQVPLAAVLDSINGNIPRLSDFLGGAAIMVGFAGINIPSDVFFRNNKEAIVELESGNTNPNDHVDV